MPVASQPDLEGPGLAARAAVLVFGEFGRRAAGDATRGTDHGTAGPVSVIGGAIRRGLVGTTPSLTDLEAGDNRARSCPSDTATPSGRIHP